jgi:hypothetical protein
MPDDCVKGMKADVIQPIGKRGNPHCSNSEPRKVDQNFERISLSDRLPDFGAHGSQALCRRKALNADQF